MNLRRSVAAALAMVMCAGGLALAAAAPASAAVTVCTYEVNWVKALNLQEDGIAAPDEIWVTIDGIFFRDESTTIARDQTRFASSLGNPTLSSTSAATIRLVEDDVWPDGNDDLQPKLISCVAEPGDTFVSTDGDYEYLVNYTVTTSQQ
jgi:hypothetical protein